MGILSLCNKDNFLFRNQNKINFGISFLWTPSDFVLFILTERKKLTQYFKHILRFLCVNPPLLLPVGIVLFRPFCPLFLLISLLEGKGTGFILFIEPPEVAELESGRIKQLEGIICYANMTQHVMHCPILSKESPTSIFSWINFIESTTHGGKEWLYS